MIKFVQPNLDHVAAISMNLRDFEKKTVEKLQVNVFELVLDAIRNEYPCFVLLVDNEPAAIFGGASETLLGECRLWMLTTPLIERYQIQLLRASKRFVQWMRENYGPVIGMVDSEFEKSRNWLRWIGFKEVHYGEFIVMRYS